MSGFPQNYKKKKKHLLGFDTVSTPQPLALWTLYQITALFRWVAVSWNDCVTVIFVLSNSAPLCGFTVIQCTQARKSPASLSAVQCCG